MKKINSIAMAFALCAASFSSYAIRPSDGHHKGRPSPSFSANMQPGKTVIKGAYAGSFLENKGQVSDQFHVPRGDVQFSFAAAPGLNIFIGSGTIHYQFSKPDANSSVFTMYRMDVELDGANKNAHAIADGQQPYFENYFLQDGDGKEVPARSFSRITYKDVYPHIDWVISSKGGSLKHEFVVHKGGKVKNIKLRYAGAAGLRVNEDGSMTATTPQGTITEAPPVSYNGTGTKVKTAFKLGTGVLSYSIDNYQGELTIDPSLAWATYYGGSDDDAAATAAVDGAGNVYMSGNTKSVAGIATTGACQVTYAGMYDDFLVKFNSSGVRQWATYYGGSGDDFGGAIAIDLSGNIYLTGTTNSSTAIATAGSFRATYMGGYDAFLVKFSSAGVRKWATYYGGSDNEFAWGVAVDRSGNVCISGQTKSDTGIASIAAFQDTMGSGGGVAYDAFLAKFDSNGTRLWGTYYGGELGDFSNAVATDDSNNIYLTGLTESMTGIATPGCHQDTNVASLHEAFVAKFNSNGMRQWGTYFGGTGDNNLNAVCVDPTGSAYITGNTTSPSEIATPGAYQEMPGGANDGYLAKFARDGTLLWATYYGDAGNDYANGVATDDSGNVFIVGGTSSTSGIATPGGYLQDFAGGSTDGFLTEFDGSGTLKWASYYGGNNDDICYFVATDHSGGVYIMGSSLSTSGIATAGSYQVSMAGGTSSGDAFLAKFTSVSLGVKVATNNNGRISLSPNPATKSLTVSSAVQMIDVTITNLTGQVVSSNACNANKAEIDVSSFPAGSYLVIINGAGSYREVKEFVKE